MELLAPAVLEVAAQALAVAVLVEPLAPVAPMLMAAVDLVVVLR